MKFISFEDTSALYETTFFPQTYARFCHILNRSRPYVLTGLVEEDFGAVTLTIDSVLLLRNSVIVSHLAKKGQGFRSNPKAPALDSI